MDSYRQGCGSGSNPYFEETRIWFSQTLFLDVHWPKSFFQKMLSLNVFLSKIQGKISYFNLDLGFVQGQTRIQFFLTIRTGSKKSRAGSATLDAGDYCKARSASSFSLEKSGENPKKFVCLHFLWKYQNLARGPICYWSLLYFNESIDHKGTLRKP